MRTKNIKEDNKVNLPESEIETLVLVRLRGRLLFAKQIESSKKYLKQINKNARV
ncbi:hypothetical protein [Pedobacter hartonius]|uniref:Uncharacterized protein n=1 Tax=Pedobacter hartonius TaxID=425514 RepID=A0A1H4HFE8_9SPHI|nr:hypothetical protein [Pedobacter hartonius]SEB20589.1 hypothetical protein SAMN05443550_1178 [Pedobacter hartonius]